jgi:membrane protease YdiL (CAAX protease family)
MRERDGSGRFAGPRTGGRIGGLAEASLVLAFFYASALIPLAPGEGAGRLASPAFHAYLSGLDALRILLVLLVMAGAEGLAAFGLRRLRAADPARALVAAAGTFAIAAASALAFSLLGAANPLMTGLPRGTPWSLLPLLALSSLATGYAEELCFRAYLMRRLEGSGLAPAWSAIASSLLFGGAHGAQGLVGVATTTLIGLWLARRWRVGRNIHEIAMGHALYDAAALVLALYL